MSELNRGCLGMDAGLFGGYPPTLAEGGFGSRQWMSKTVSKLDSAA